MDPEVVRRLRVMWLIALACVTVFALVFGFRVAALTAAAFVGATVLAVCAFVLWLIMGDTSVPLRALLIGLFFGGLFVELRGILAVFESVQTP